MNSNPNDIIAPFVLKTYQMVNDPSLDGYIRWGPANNTFIVVDPLDFSQRLLPANFKHNNFSSFVRQLNTYGFKKVDPDRWEFANESFLKGQTHLLKNIARKKQFNIDSISNSSSNSNSNSQNNILTEDEMAREIAKLKQEQNMIEQELLGMNKRLEVTENRPDQMMALLHKVADDPQILPRIMLQKDQRLDNKKRQRILEEGQVMNTYNGNEPSSSRPRTNVVNMEHESLNGRYVNNIDGSDIISFEGFLPETEARRSPEYPFSLFGNGF